MTEDRKNNVLSDDDWQQLKPLIEAARPPHKTEQVDMRRTIEAIIWKHRRGAPWRAIPAELGPWWRPAQTFIRWSHLGVWERLLELAQERGLQTGMVFLDGTSIRAHQKAAGAEKRGSPRRRVTGVRPRAAHARASAPRPAYHRCRRPRPRLVLGPGQAHELPLAPALLAVLMFIPLWIVGDRGYAARTFRALVRALGSHPAVPAKRNEKQPVECPPWIYTHRNRVERLWNRLKEWRGVATRYEKTASSFKGVLCLAATMDWLKVPVSK